VPDLADPGEFPDGRVVSLVFEPLILTIHIVLGLVFAVLAVAHLIQRRRVSARLLARPAGPAAPWPGRPDGWPWPTRCSPR